MFLIVSLFWFILSAIISVAYGSNPVWLFIFFLMTIVYIPVMIYFVNEGNIARVSLGVDITIIATLIYLVIELVLAFAFIVNATSG